MSEQNPLTAAVEGVAEVAANPSAWYDEFLSDPCQRVPEGGVVDLDQGEGHCEPEQ